MVYSNPITTHSLSINTIEGHVASKSYGNHDEIGSISCRIWRRYGPGIVIVGCVENYLSEITKEKEKCEHVWCITCKTKDHRKEYFPAFTQYMAIGAPNPLTQGVGYYEICKTWLSIEYQQ
jgi:hypothetical protein